MTGTPIAEDSPSASAQEHAAFAGSRLAASALHRRNTKRAETSRNSLPAILQQDMLPQHRQILASILGLLPSPCSARLQNLVVRYDHPAQRGLAGKSTVILSGNVSDEEFRALAVHEILGHFHELGCLDGTKQSVVSAYKDGDEPVKADDPSALFYAISWKDATTPRDDAASGDFVSGYALKGDAFEDLAETVVAYVLHHDALQELARTNDIIDAKLRWMQRYMPLAVRNVATGTYAYAEKRPWDMTKLAYEWRGKTTDGVLQNNE
jgi:hypothetical protein